MSQFNDDKKITENYAKGDKKNHKKELHYSILAL